MENDTADYVIVSDRDATDDNLSSDQASEHEKAQRKILAWLEPSDYLASSSEFKKHQIARTPGTGAWLTATEKYRQWHDGHSHGALWIKGVPGSGKSVIAAEIARQLLEEDGGKTPVLFFFFRHIITSNRSPISLLRDWLAQALPHSPLICNILKTLVDDGRALDSVSHDELWRALLTGLKYLGKVYCVADALDEMDAGNELFLQRLADLGKLNPASVKLFITSRPVPRIDKCLNISSVLQIRLEQHRIDQDIASYVNHRFDDVQLAALGDRDSANTFRISLVNTLCHNGQGLFLYVKLMSDKIATALKDGASYLESMAILHSLPDNLGNMYTRMLKDHSEMHNVNQDMQVAVLQWATHASRPLRLIELAGAIHAEVSKNSVNFGEVKSLVRASCGPLLEIFEDETIQVIHHSFTEFLMDRKRSSHPLSSELVPFPVINFEESHRALASTCLRALTTNGLKYYRDDWLISESYRIGLSKKQPFLIYAGQNWCHHASLYDVEDLEFFTLLDRLILQDIIPRKDSETDDEDEDIDEKYKFRMICIPLVKDYAMETRTGISKLPSALFGAAKAGLSNYTKYLLAKGFDVNGDGDGVPPICTAAAGGHLKVVQVLAAHGADLDPEDSVGMKPILYAASGNYAAVVKFLLDNGVDYNSRSTREDPSNFRCGRGHSAIGGSALEYASRYGHVETLMELAPYANSEELNRSLHWAAERGQSKIIRALLEDIKVTPDDETRWKRPLRVAVSCLDVDSVRALLDHGADVGKGSRVHPSLAVSPARNDDSDDLIHGLAKVGFKSQTDLNRYSEVLDLLTAAGADINGLNSRGQTLLCSAMSEGHAPLIEILLMRGADASIADKDGNTVFESKMMHSMSTLSRKTIELLVRNGTQLNARRKKDGKTALHLAVRAGDEDTFKNMLAFGADPTLVDNDGNTILHAAYQHLNSDRKINIEAFFPLDIVRSLINKKNNLGETAVHTLASTEWVDGEFRKALEELVKAGVDLEAQNNSGLTALLRVIDLFRTPRQLNRVKMLLELGSNINARDRNGKTALHIASRGANSFAVFQLLVNSGADPQWTDFAGNTVLHEAASMRLKNSREECMKFIKYLIGLGLSPAVRNHHDQTPLHHAVGIPIRFRYRRDRCPVIDLLADEKNGGSVNHKDNNNIRPIHLAAAASVDDVWQLIDLGADATAVTAESRSPLHIACRACQSNVVGVLLTHYSEIDHQLITLTDHTGRTALHDASRSGQVESVRLLLEAGANVHAKDKKGKTPLRTCSEFPEEDACWKTLIAESDGVGIHFQDPFRRINDSSDWSRKPAHRKVRIGGVVRTLLDAGAAQGDFSIEGQQSAFPDSEISLALRTSCIPMLRAIRSWLKQGAGEEERASIETGFEPSFFENFLAPKFDPEPQMIQDECIILDEFNEILDQDDEEIVLALIKHGVDLDPRAWNSEWHVNGRIVKGEEGNTASPLHTMARSGYFHLLKQIGLLATNSNDLNIKAVLEKMRQGSDDSVQPILLAACESTTYNIDVIKVLVDDLKMNVNHNDLLCKMDGSVSYAKGNTALHILAQGREWWHPEAIAFLLRRGADPNAKNALGETPLHVAASQMSDNKSTGHWRVFCVKELLFGKADPNILNDKKVSCLYRASSNSEIVQMLLNSGAHVSRGNPPPIFGAIHNQNNKVLRIFLEAGADCNATMFRLKEEKNFDQLKRFKDCSEYVLLHAACRHTDILMDPFSRDEAKWPELVETLLSHGADVTMKVKNDETILHYICKHEGILDPFLSLTDIDWEIRDSKGWTPLLAASEGARLPFFRDRDPRNILQLAHFGVQRTVKSYESQTILHILLLNQRGNVVLQLMQLFDDVRNLSLEKDRKGFAPIHLSLKFGDIMATRALMKEGADITEADPDGNTPLHHLADAIVSHWDTTAIKDLFNECLSLGIDLNTRNSAGQTPLFKFLASTLQREGEDRCCHEFNHFAEADLFVRDNAGRTALHIVAARRDPWPFTNATLNLFKMLLKLGLDPLAEDDEMMTPLDVAKANANNSILDLFARPK